MGVTTSKRVSSMMPEYRRESDSAPYTDGQIQHVRTARSSKAHRVSAIFLPWLLALVLLVGWYIGTAYGHVNSLILPTPTDVFTRLVSGISSGLYLSNAFVTIEESVFGFLLAILVALPLGYGLAKSRLLAMIIQPYFVAGQAIPAIVIAPLFVLWLGYGVLPIIILCTLVVLFPMVINTILGIQTIDGTLIEAAHVEGASGWSMLAYIEFPLALPAILAAIRTGFTLSIVGALVGEFVSGGDQGLGSLVLLAKNQYDMPLMFATLVVLAILAIIYYTATWFLVKLADIVY